jgi:hypothetical protein
MVREKLLVPPGIGPLTSDLPARGLVTNELQ